MSSPSVADLVDVAEADVYKSGRLAGRLRRDGDDVEFAYVEEYLSTPAAPAVAVTLPRDGEPVRATAGAVPPFFAGLLPEGARLQAVTAGAHTSVDDHLTLLLVVGSDAIGDVQVLPRDAPPTDPPALLDPDRAAAEDFSQVFARATSTDLDELDRVALPGVQVKVSAAMISTPVGTTSGPAILKLNPPVIRSWSRTSTSSSAWPAPAACRCRATACCPTEPGGWGCSWNASTGW